MAQKSITSFFSKIPPTKTNTDAAKCTGTATDSSKNETEEFPTKNGSRSGEPTSKLPPKQGSPEVVKSVKKNSRNRQSGESKTIKKSKTTAEEKSTVEDKSMESPPKEKNKTTKNKKTPTGSGGKKRRKIIEVSESSSEEESTDKKIKLDEENTEQPKSNKENESKSETAVTKRDEENNTKSESKEKQVTLTMFGPNTKDKTKTTDANNTNEIEYDPSKSKYHPIDDASWKRLESVPYAALASTWSQIEAISARLRIADILCNYFRSVIVLSPEDLLPSVYLCLNRLAPAHEGLELGIAETHLMKAICQSTGRTVAQLKADVHNLGDLGLVAERSRTNQRTLFSFRPARLTVRNVHSTLKEIAAMSGHASVQRKVDKIRAMMVACDKLEARYLTRSLAGKLRIGLAEQTVLQALAGACSRTPPGQDYPPTILDASSGVSSDRFKTIMDEATLAIRTVCSECPDYGLVVPALLDGGISELSARCPMKPGIPLKPMLAHPTKGVSEVLQRFEGMRFTCEWKYDGERAQIHRAEDGTVRIYSRNQEDNTSKYPDVINRLSKCIGEGVQSFILDCESVAWNTEGDGHILPFQVLSTRKRKGATEADIQVQVLSTRKRKGATEADIQVQVCVFMFDLLYLNGEPLVRKPLLERRELLKKHFKESAGEWAFASSLDATTVDEIQDFLDESVKGNCEGLMVKTLEVEATYEIARRSRNWLKLKKDYLDGVGDTLDLVVIGGYLGKGKRTGTYGGFLLACYDQENEEYQSMCKLGTGFTDADLRTLTDALKPYVIDGAKSYYRSDSAHQPDHWFDTVQVWEVKCADLSLSPVHRAAVGIIDPEKGISLRFPRFVKVRDDKTAEEATSARQVAEMYSNQDQIKNQAKSNTAAAEEDYY